MEATVTKEPTGLVLRDLDLEPKLYFLSQHVLTDSIQDYGAL